MKRILSPYTRFYRSMLGVTGIAAAGLAAAAAFVWPLWYLAVNFRGAYTFLVLASLAAAIVVVSVSAARRDPGFVPGLAKKLVCLASFVAVFAGLYGVIVLWSRSWTLGIAGLAAVLGAIAFMRRKPKGT